ncbi:MAG: YggS family pyridoxal phosphate-dependent enzyme [Betaproteobacteria bacterium]|nr:YggS family pyridoxal phosphate-dependent enzyme [Betaproteobacteria bacterium]
MATVKANLQAVRQRIARAAAAAGRDPAAIALLAVSKTHPAALVEQAVRAGQRSFGENYVQEALQKMDALAAWPGGAAPALEWHLIGPLQSNKTRVVAERFQWVQSLDRERIAQRLSEQRPAGLAPLEVLLQVNVSGEASKSGVAPREAPAVARAVAQLPRLRLRGLMAIPEPSGDAALQRARFRAVRELFEELKERGLALDTLSMGMSDDLEAAIAEGATMVRIGTAIFGPREARRGAARNEGATA